MSRQGTDNLNPRGTFVDEAWTVLDTRWTVGALPAAVSLEAAGLSRVAQRRAPLPVSLDQEAIYHGEKFSMTAPATWPTRNHEAAQPDDDDPGGQAAPAEAMSGHKHAHEVITEMADLLRDNRSGMLADGCLLGAVAAGFALEAGVAARELRPGLIGVINLGLLCGIVFCWLVAAFLVARASRPVLNAVSELRWVTGAPLDPRPLRQQRHVDWFA